MVILEKVGKGNKNGKQPCHTRAPLSMFLSTGDTRLQTVMKESGCYELGAKVQEVVPGDGVLLI